MAQEVTQSVAAKLWPLKTRAQLDEAGWEVLDDPTLHADSASTLRQPAQEGLPGSTPLEALQITTAVPLTALTAPLGSTLVWTAMSGFQAMTDAELSAAGFPTATT